MRPYGKLLVLDLDETLIHAREADMLEDLEPRIARAPDFYVGRFAVFRRPLLSSFLADVLDSFQHVGVWTAATLPYALPVLDHIVDRSKLAFVWGRERCTYRYDRERDAEVWLKPLKKLCRVGYKRHHVLYVDDSPEKIAQSYSNLVPVRPFVGSSDDQELQHLRSYLHTLGPLENVRPVEKRMWRREILARAP